MFCTSIEQPFFPHTIRENTYTFSETAYLVSSSTGRRHGSSVQNSSFRILAEERLCRRVYDMRRT